MWNNSFIGLVCIVGLNGCGQAVSEAPKINEKSNPAPAHSSIDDVLKDTRNEELFGELPEHVDENIAEFQARLIEDLASGVPGQVFAQAQKSPAESIIQYGPNVLSIPHGPKLNDGRYKMHLVKHAVIRIEKSRYLECGQNGIYRATIAATTYLKREPTRTESNITIVEPYEVHVCDGENGIRYALVTRKE